MTVNPKGNRSEFPHCLLKRISFLFKKKIYCQASAVKVKAPDILSLNKRHSLSICYYYMDLYTSWRLYVCNIIIPFFSPWESMTVDPVSWPLRETEIIRHLKKKRVKLKRGYIQVRRKGEYEESTYVCTTQWMNGKTQSIVTLMGFSRTTFHVLSQLHSNASIVLLCCCLCGFFFTYMKSSNFLHMTQTHTCSFLYEIWKGVMWK